MALTSSSLTFDPDRSAAVVWGLRARLQDLVLGPLQPLESGGPWKASRRDETSFFATASKEPIGSAASATKPGHRSLDGTLSGGVLAIVHHSDKRQMALERWLFHPEKRNLRFCNAVFTQSAH